MNLYEEDTTQADNEKTKKIVTILAVTIGILLLLCIAIVVYIYYIQATELKVYINGTQVSVAEDEVIVTDDNIYISIKDMCEKIGYTYNNGEYKMSYYEDKDKCYLTNGVETVSYILGADSIYKVTKENNQDYEYYNIDEPVISNNEKLYTTVEGLSLGCNLSISHTKKSNTLTIYTLPYLYDYYSSRISGANADETNYENKKAILYGMIIVENDNKEYGVKDLNGEIIIGQKYSEISFVSYSQEFIVKTENDKVGILTKDANTKIKPEYDSIKQISDTLGLYLVCNNNKYGIINENEQKIAYLEYDEIGIDQSKFTNDDIENPYILYGECIPVKKNGKWGMIDTNGNEILPLQYDEFGCKTSSDSELSTSPLLLVPEYKAIVVRKNNFYGLYNSSGEELIPIATTDMYSVTSSGTKNYYVTYSGQRIDILDYLLNTLKKEPVNYLL